MANLENVSTDYFRQILAEVNDSSATERLMAAITYKEIDEVTQEDAAELYGYSEGWASKWFNRLERLEEEPFEEVVYDKPRSGRPSELSDQEHDQFVQALHESPEEVGIDAPAWSVPLAHHYLNEEFDVDYCERHVRRLMSEAGLSSLTRTLIGSAADYPPAGFSYETNGPKQLFIQHPVEDTPCAQLYSKNTANRSRSTMWTHRNLIPTELSSN